MSAAPRPPEAREWLGPLCVDWIGPTVTRAIELFQRIAPACAPATRTACRDDAHLLDRLLAETSRPHAQGRVLGGRTGLTLIAALTRLLTTMRADLVRRPDVAIQTADAPIVARLDDLITRLEAATRTLEAEPAP